MFVMKEFNAAKIRFYKRGRHLRMRMDAQGQLKISAPTGTAKKYIQDFIAINVEWIESQRDKQNERGGSSELKDAMQIDLPAIGRQLTLKLQFSARLDYHEKDGIIYVYGTNQSDFRRVLKEYLRSYAYIECLVALKPLADEMGVDFNKLSIRQQKTRWGSCSNAGNISLNLNLLFLEPSLMRHILIHELAHRSYMNHSRQFWALVARYDENWREHDHAVNVAGRNLPPWLLHLSAP